MTSYDKFADVLYVNNTAYDPDIESNPDIYGEEEGFFIIRKTEKQVVGVTVVDFKEVATENLLKDLSVMCNLDAAQLEDIKNLL